MIELLKPFLEKLINYIDEGNYWSLSINILFVGGFFALIGYVISWFLNQRKVQKEIEKLSVESKEKRIELLANIHLLRNNYYNNILVAQTSTQSLISAINQNNIALAETAWLNLKSVFFNDVLNSFEKYLETNEIYLEGNRKKEKYFIDDEIFNILNTSLNMLQIINTPNILTNINKSAVTLDKTTLRPLFRYIDSYKRFYSFRTIYRRWKIYFELYKKSNS